MRKLLISFAIIFVSIATIVAQETGDSILRSKKGVPILPQAGDWAIGADALPYLEYLGNMNNGTSDNTLDLGETILYGKYFLTDNTAVRIAFGISNYNSMSRAEIRDDAAYFQDNLSTKKTQDTYKEIRKDYTLDLGYQMYRGYGRLRGFYGVHIGYDYYRYKEKYTYGNPISSVNQQPTVNYISYSGTGARTLESDNGIQHSIFGGFIAGVEYYFAPKICIGGEITLTGYNSWRSQGNAKTERWNGSGVAEEDVAGTPRGRTYTSLYTQRPFGGGLYLMFHF